MASKSALLMLTGGTDSVTLLAWAVKEGYNCTALYLRTVEKDTCELECAKTAAAKEKVKLDIIDFSGPVAALSAGKTQIPFGSTIVLSMAVSYATRLGIDTVLFSLNAEDVDVAGNQEPTREYIDKFEATLKTVRQDIQVLTPFIGKKKFEVFELGSKLGVDYSKTWSCNNVLADLHCGKCRSCTDRRKAFDLSGIADTTSYERAVGHGPELEAGICICLMFC